MAYDSTITFTLDTICPWTYLALRRLLQALHTYRTANPDAPATFHLRFAPYQLYPEHSSTGEDKHAWYMHKRYQGSEALMHKYETLMRMYGASVAPPIAFRFGGVIANTLPAHRCIYYVQDVLRLGEDRTLALVEALYRAYFEEERHPGSVETLVGCLGEVGVGEGEARAFVEGEEGEEEVRGLVRGMGRDGVDSVPHVVVEGRRRDFTETGAKEVEAYVTVLEKVAKECK
ncbi:thioredoxin-like protein [Pseudovirgaria hyperparasitica]|uniref:Thioredoxin-like protein n=1 Tax=Pseudovirgaria hyperparasitica TaxID=470096 RepID=A0A6A6W882_9PEZI|nr:thioredoxin-like protein [Pseudovirgaria hyperparasitica]KAF2759062.1 thioredoxin-like protein [Pseudovirgaria hyperparasitica]